HVLAEAVQELFPGTQVTIGPNVEDGFYYDFARNEPFSTDDFPAIEKRMHEIVERDEKISREVWDRAEAIKHFRDIGEAYKAEIIEGIPAGEPVTVYRQGNWKDLCRGPHLPSTRHVGKALKLTKLGAAMDLFHQQEEGKGMIFWHPKGWTLYRTLQNYVRRRVEEAGYEEVK